MRCLIPVFVLHTFLLSKYGGIANLTCTSLYMLHFRKRIIQCIFATNFNCSSKEKGAYCYLLLCVGMEVTTSRNYTLSHIPEVWNVVYIRVLWYACSTLSGLYHQLKDVKVCGFSLSGMLYRRRGFRCLAQFVRKSAFCWRNTTNVRVHSRNLPSPSPPWRDTSAKVNWMLHLEKPLRRDRVNGEGAFSLNLNHFNLCRN